jgi:hypothetical protein
MKKKLLFVTYLDEHPADGLSYVIDLAKILHEDLTIFLLYKRKISKKIEDTMTAVTFAEANEHETARETVKEGKRVDGDSLDLLVGKCQESGINVDIKSFKSDAVSALEDYFKRKNGIDMILLGPNVPDNVNVSSRKIKKLLHTISRPIVTIARQPHTVSG